MTNTHPVNNLTPVKEIATGTETDIIRDLAVSNMTQTQIAAKYGIDKSKITRFKQAPMHEIEEVRVNHIAEWSGLLVKDQEWRLKEREKDMHKLDQYKSAESVLARETIRKNAAEELGQIAPKTNIVIVPVDHRYEGVSVELV